MNFTFFTDRDLGKKFPSILSAAGLTIERHQDHFADDAPDEEWLEAIGKKGWVAITHDHRIRYMPNELDAVIRHRVSLVNWRAPSSKPCPGLKRFSPAARRLSSPRSTDRRPREPNVAKRPDEWNFGIRKTNSRLYREGLYQETARPRWFLHGLFG